MLSAPTSTAPALSNRSISVASRDAGGKSRLIFEPARVEIPFTSNRFFTAKGTPASGPAFLPASIAASTSRALARARSAVTSVKALRTGSCCTILASVASMTSDADSLPELTALAISEADVGVDVAMAASGPEDTGRLGFVRQRELVDELRHPQRYFEIGAHRAPPGILDREVQGFRDRGDVIVETVRRHFAPVALRPLIGAFCCWSCVRKLRAKPPVKPETGLSHCLAS